MFKNIDDLIELNLNLLNNTNGYYLHRQELKFLDNERFGDCFKLAELLLKKNLITLHIDSCTLTEFGKNIYDNGGWKKYIANENAKIILFDKQKIIEFEKSKIDLILAEKMLGEYPYTKWLARIGAFIGILLGLKELYILIKK